MSDAKKYAVSIPIRGSIGIVVSASSEEDAVEEAYRLYHESGPDDFELEWETHEGHCTLKAHAEEH